MSRVLSLCLTPACGGGTCGPSTGEMGVCSSACCDLGQVPQGSMQKGTEAPSSRLKMPQVETPERGNAEVQHPAPTPSAGA